ncbi:AMP-binding protein [candidate division KSB1 bacterium]|nr:AMP-binding protein [candidate division KSB1 bacterium]
MPDRTLVQMFEESVAKFGQNTLVLEKQDAEYQSLSYLDIKHRVDRFAAGLLDLGVKKGDRIALISEGRADWVVSELGILYTGAINVPLSVKLDELSDLKFRLLHAGCRCIVVSQQHAHKVFAVKKDLPDLEKIILLDPTDSRDQDVITLQNLLEKGKLYLEKNRSDFEKLYKSVKESDPVNICYTSGTTADPKGIILTHRNYTANVDQASALLPIPEYYSSLLILPWDHSFAHTAGIYTLMKNGASMASVQLGKTPMETLKNIPINIKEIRPTFLLSVPALAQNFRKNIEKGIRQKGAVVERMFRCAMRLKYLYNGNGWNKGKGLRWIVWPLCTLFDRILFSKVKDNFGGRLEFFIGGGALLDIELQRFFYALGMPMYQGYGLTEASPIISANVPLRHKLGSSGTPVVNMEIKICNENGVELPIGEKGEIVIKGENVMAGYWNNEKATKETIREGWLYTGDLGYRDKDGFLYVLGREKSLLISNDGEKYSPEGIEEAIISHSPFIDQLMLYNNQSPYTVALLVPNRDALLKWLVEQGKSCTTEDGQNAVIKRLESDINQFREKGKYAGQFPSKWLPASFAILGEGFTEKNGLMNSTMKIVRGKISEYYKDRLDDLYTPEGKEIYNERNRNIVSRLSE